MLQDELFITAVYLRHSFTTYPFPNGSPFNMPQYFFVKKWSVVRARPGENNNQKLITVKVANAFHFTFFLSCRYKSFNLYCSQMHKFQGNYEK